MQTPFITKKSRRTDGFPMGQLLGTREVDGEIGIEIEVEGNKFPKPDTETNGYVPKEWKYHHDGSLRGEDNAEYVLKKPLMFSEVPRAISNLWSMFNEFGSVLDDSNRTSVHVHLNAQKWYLNRVCSFVALYFAVEEILTAWCGEHRVGNLFCLRAKDAPAIVSKLKRFFQEDGKTGLSDGLHYAGLNAQALMKFGSLEIRSLRGVTDPQTILDWVAILERIYKMSADFEDPRKVCENFSGGGPLAFYESILGDKASRVREGAGFDNQQLMASLYEGIRLAQDLCYCRDWSLYKPADITKDPFGRNEKEQSSLYAQLLAQHQESFMVAPVQAANPAVPSAWAPIGGGTFYYNHNAGEGVTISVPGVSDEPSEWWTQTPSGSDFYLGDDE